MTAQPERKQAQKVIETPVFSALRIAEIMTLTGQKVLAPTPEQTRMIEHPLGGTTLVVAGAGSGKTETMANRVVWLVSNGLAQPSEILGLTFTRKAAGELNERIAGRLDTFMTRLGELAQQGALSALESKRAAELRLTLQDGLDLPQVSTYNSFAVGVVQEFGSLAGVTSQVTLLDDANAWQMAREIVCSSSDPDLIEANDSISVVVARVLSLDHAVADNLTTFARVDEVITEFERISSLPYSEKQPTADKQYAIIAELLENMRGTHVALRLAKQFAAYKKENGFTEFSDQLTLAVHTIQTYQAAVKLISERTPIVLLDEVQDTSVGQTTLLATLFRGCSVMAVGDPHQSIYGFRGASADNLRSFHRDFSLPGHRNEGVTLSLSVSWRNPSEVLSVANCLSSPLTENAPIDVPILRSKEEYLGGETLQSKGVSLAGQSATVDWRYPETTDDEYEGIADWLIQERNLFFAEHNAEPTAAIVMRARREMPQIAEILHQRGVPAQIVGVGGLLSTPEITEIVSTLRCIWYADAGNDVIRLLSSPRFRVGPADLMGLKRAARWFGQRDMSHKRMSAEDLQTGSPIADADTEYTLIDALDAIASLKSLDHRALDDVSEMGRIRLQEAGVMLRSLRTAVSNDIPALLRAVEYALRIDIEIEANESSLHQGSATARANIDAFAEIVEGFLRTTETPSLARVLAWLERVSQLDQQSEYVPDPAAGTVQIITAHGSKGLEWDFVVVPRLVTDEFPGRSKEGMGWLRAGQIPDELRGDAAARPQLNWRIATTQEELRDRIKGSKKTVDGEKVIVPGYTDELVDRHLEEERRLVYVAVTRAARKLLLTGSFWSSATKPRHPSPYLQELSAANIIGELPDESAHEEHPRDRPARTLSWPPDPLGSRAHNVLRAAQQVQSSRNAVNGQAHHDLTAVDEIDGDAVIEIDATVELLLAEFAADTTQNKRSTPLANRITASSFHEFVTDPLSAERRRLRPIPGRPYRKTRTGNRFHEWVERRATTAHGTSLQLGGFDEDTQDPGYDEFDYEADLQLLIEKFERSRWANRQPKEVELEVSLPFAGRQLVCKLDAVYAEEFDGRMRYEVVDWKSGRSPQSPAEKQLRFLQIELYRHAYSLWAKVPPEDISVALFYVAEGIEINAEHPLSFEELESLWLAAAEQV